MTSHPPPSRLRKPMRRGGKPMPNSSTRIPAHFAVMKWPNSCTSTHNPKTGMAASKNQLFITYSFVGLFHIIHVLFYAPMQMTLKLLARPVVILDDEAQALLQSVL